jgi:PhnB protein
MTIHNNIHVIKDLPNNRLIVVRDFDAPVDLVWRAWTESELLDLWWAPKPWRAQTKSLQFKEGGTWLYAMIGPNGEKHWSRVDYLKIEAMKSFSSVDSFCDEHGNPSKDLPSTKWETSFRATETGTKVLVELFFRNKSDLVKLMDMGFESGFAAALDNLGHYLNTQFRLRKEYKTTNMARVTTYLNFPGKTEEAFNFYKKVFKGKFTGAGLKRFGDIEMPADIPPMSDADKKLIIHAELTIMNGHVLMATDSPESMGFKMEYGNNMHINVEPESRAEAERLFQELSEGGKVSMPLQDMFWGAYFASFTDRYGVNWMINHQEKN